MREFFPQSSSSNGGLEPVLTGNGERPMQEQLLGQAKALASCSCMRARALVGFEKAEELGILPIGFTSHRSLETLQVAWSSDKANESSHELEQVLRFITGYPVELSRIDPRVYRSALKLAYFGDEGRLFESKAAIHARESQDQERQRPIRKISQGEKDAEGEYLQTLLSYATSHGATDIHLVPAREGGLLRMRMDGKLLSHNQTMCALSTHESLLRRVKVLCDLPITAATSPLDGAFEFRMGSHTYPVRVSIMPTLHGERAALRLLHKQDSPELNQIGLSNFTLSCIKKTSLDLQGAILLCGATGSGKTTLAYALLSSLTGSGLNLVSIEDPVEVDLEGVIQTPVSPDKDFSFEIALQGMLRQDPDVILLGEMRSSQSAQIALEAALTGHLVVSTVHATTVFSLMSRLRYLGLTGELVSTALKLIICVKLVPQLCTHCRVIDLERSQASGLEVFESKGCTGCDYSGTAGRALLEQVLVVDQQVGRCIRAGAQSYEEFEPFLNSCNYQGFGRGAMGMLRSHSISLEQYHRIVGL